MKIIRIALMNKNKEQGAFCQSIDDKNWFDIFKDAELTADTGDYYVIEIIEMSRKEYNKLGEFTGF